MFDVQVNLSNDSNVVDELKAAQPLHVYNIVNIKLNKC